MLQRQTLRSQVIEYLLELIRSGQVKPGEQLPTEKSLTETLGVSRTAIREAVKSLESLDLISVRPRVGAIVKAPSPSALFRAEHLSVAAHKQQTDLLIEFRGILEVGLASLASIKADEADIRSMEKAIDEHSEAIEASQPAYPADIAFH
ncbi:MAG: GntR family transcriptional regulator, partial [Bryobacteraceae bacterium]